MSYTDPLIYLVDDDPRVREALEELLASRGYRAITFASAAEYVQFPKLDVPACLILDVRLPDIDGLQLQRQIAGSDHPPIVFISAHGDIPLSVRAMKAGAVDFLPKPVRAAELLGAVRSAISQDADARMRRAERESLRQRASQLTPREREVLPLVVSGLLNKEAAAELGISEATLQIHRGRIMKKMKAESLAELVRMAALLEVPLVNRQPA
jgi:FixJ family two-component response regulator